MFNNSAKNLRWIAHVWILVRFLISLEMSTGVPPRVPPGAYSAEPLGREPRKYTYFRRLHCEFAFGIFHLSSYTECCPNDNIQYGVWHFRERFVDYHHLCVILMKSIRYSCWYICLFFSGQNVITLFNALDYDWTHVWGHWMFHKTMGVKCQMNDQYMERMQWNIFT